MLKTVDLAKYFRVGKCRSVLPTKECIGKVTAVYAKALLEFVCTSAES